MGTVSFALSTDGTFPLKGLDTLLAEKEWVHKKTKKKKQGQKRNKMNMFCHTLKLWTCPIIGDGIEGGLNATCESIIIHSSSAALFFFFFGGRVYVHFGAPKVWF